MKKLRVIYITFLFLILTAMECASGLSEDNPGFDLTLYPLAVSSTEVELTWNVPVKVRDVLSYRILRNGTSLQEMCRNNLRDTGLNAGGSYTYTVHGLNRKGDTVIESDPVTVTLPPSGRTFYCDPVNGSMSNDGSQVKPWKTLKEVIDGKLIETWDYKTHPWKKGGPMIRVNQGAPVKGGDTIVLLTGNHGRVTINRAQNNEFITIKGGNGQSPVLEQFTLTAGRKWILSGVTISRCRDSGEDDTALVTIRKDNWAGDASEVIVENCRILSAGDSTTSSWTSSIWDTLPMNGISVRADRTCLRNNECRNVEFGISVDGNMCQVTGNKITNLVSDAYRGIGNDHIFEGNEVINFYAINENHDDMFQSWSVKGVPPERIVLRGNRFICNDGSAENSNRPWGSVQGIGCFDGFYIDWVVENNLVVVDHWHGISFYGARGCRIVNNTVLLPYNSLSSNRTPWIHIVSHKDGRASSDCLVRNNIAMSMGNDRGAVWDHNVTVAKSQAEYTRLFTGPASLDFSPRGGTELVDTGSGDCAPPIDILSNTRPAGNGYDIGAWEML